MGPQQKDNCGECAQSKGQRAQRVKLYAHIRRNGHWHPLCGWPSLQEPESTESQIRFRSLCMRVVIASPVEGPDCKISFRFVLLLSRAIPASQTDHAQYTFRYTRFWYGPLELKICRQKQVTPLKNNSAFGLRTVAPCQSMSTKIGELSPHKVKDRGQCSIIALRKSLYELLVRNSSLEKITQGYDPEIAILTVHQFHLRWLGPRALKKNTSAARENAPIRERRFIFEILVLRSVKMPG